MLERPRDARRRRLPRPTIRRDLGPQDIVIVSTKATALPASPTEIAPLVGKDTLVVFPQNGMTWWYPRAACRPAASEAAGNCRSSNWRSRFSRRCGQDQVLGGIIYSANEVAAPGVIKNNSPDA